MKCPIRAYILPDIFYIYVIKAIVTSIEPNKSNVSLSKHIPRAIVILIKHYDTVIFMYNSHKTHDLIYYAK